MRLINDVIMQTFRRSKPINWQLPFQQNYVESELGNYHKHNPRANATQPIWRVCWSLRLCINLELWCERIVEAFLFIFIRDELKCYKFQQKKIYFAQCFFLKNILLRRNILLRISFEVNMHFFLEKNSNFKCCLISRPI